MRLPYCMYLPKYITWPLLNHASITGSNEKLEQLFYVNNFSMRWI